MKNIVLTGMPGVGKTSVGVELSRLLTEFSLVDVDSVIEKNEGEKISKIFETKGENFFRDLETEAIKGLSKVDNQIITTGGGAVIRSENIDLLKKNGIIFYLKADIKTILKRLSNDTSRPLLACADREKKLEELMAKRELAYQKADFSINTENKTQKEIAEEIKVIYENEFIEC